MAKKSSIPKAWSSSKPNPSANRQVNNFLSNVYASAARNGDKDALKELRKRGGFYL